MRSQFLNDVAAFEGQEIAEETAVQLQTASSPMMALFLARRKCHMPQLLAASALFAQKFNSTRD